MERLFREVDDQLGRVTALVNNAGILEREMRVEEMTGERLDRVLSTNVIGCFLCAREAVRRYFEEKHAESMEIFSRLSGEDLQRRCITPAGASITVWKWLRAMVKHEIHHRGQLYLRLGLVGVPAPPFFGLTSEEVWARSVGAIAEPQTASENAASPGVGSPSPAGGAGA